LLLGRSSAALGDRLSPIRPDADLRSGSDRITMRTCAACSEARPD
jgi:hypothetical protein